MPGGHIKGDVVLELFEEQLWVIQVSGRYGIIFEAVLKNKETQERRQILEKQFPPTQGGKRSKYLGRVA